jgi:hypothetical protein
MVYLFNSILTWESIFLASLAIVFVNPKNSSFPEVAEASLGHLKAITAN